MYNKTNQRVTACRSYTTTYSYDANNRLTMESKNESGTTTTSMFTYDDNGNLLTELDATNTAVVSHSYDGFNRLISSVVGTTTITYAYNPQGLRTSRTVGAATTEYLLDGGNVVGEITNGTTTTYLRGANLISDGTNYYLHNAHGDVVQLTDSTGTVTQTYDYDAFGNEKDPDEDDTNPFRFCGEYFDTATGLYYLRARYYDPTVGRFTQEDTHWNTANMIYGDTMQKLNVTVDAEGGEYFTAIPQLLAIRQAGNLYGYAVNSPVMFADHTGEIAFLIITGLIGAAIGGIAGAIHSYTTTGEISWQSVGIGALTGGLLGGGLGAVSGVLVAGSVVASTAAVTTGFSTLAVAISSGGWAAGVAFLMQNIQNATSNYTVLGHSPGYLELAKRIKARVFEIPTEIWNTLTGAQQWALNQEFLDVSISKGHEFIFSTNVYSARIGSYLYAEIQYLLSNGYHIVDEGWRMIR